MEKSKQAKQICLTDLPLNNTAVVCYVSDQSIEMLDLLGHKKIAIGTKLEVKRKFSYDRSMEIKIRQQAPINISEQLAKNIFVKYGT
jgi:DtxR family Mn-dependent transcriptional regulator